MEKYVSTAWLSQKLRDVQFYEARNFGDPLMTRRALGVLWNDIQSAPTVDVVTRSEVDELKAIIADHKASEERLEELYSNAKTEVERLEDINERDVENIRLAKQEVARVTFTN